MVTVSISAPEGAYIYTGTGAKMEVSTGLFDQGFFSRKSVDEYVGGRKRYLLVKK